MNPLRRLAGETAWYGLSSIVGRLVNYLLLPFYTNASLGIFQPEDYGVVRELYAYVALLNIIYTFGMETTYFRYASRYEEQRVFNQATSFVTLISLFCSLVIIAAATPLVNAMGYTGKEVYLYYLAAVIAIDAIVAIPFAQLRWAKQPRRFAFVKLTNIFLNIALNVFFLLICRDIAAGKYLTSLQPIAAWFYDPTLKVGYVFLANLMANTLFFLLLRRSFLKYRPYWDKTLLKDMLRYAYPLIFMGLAGLINTMADVYFIKYYMPASLYPAVQQLVGAESTVGQYMLGAYNACIKFAIFMMLVVQAYRYAAEPFFFAKAKEKGAPQLFAQAMLGFTLVGCMIMIGVCLNVSWLKDLLIRNEAYYFALEVVPYAMLGNLLLGIYFNLTIWFKLVDKTYYGTYLTFIGAATTIVGNFLLVPVYGVLGAAMAMVVTYLVMCALCYYWGQRYYPIPYPLKKISFYVIATVSFVFLALKVSPKEGWSQFFVQNTFTLAFVGLVVTIEKKTFMKFLRSFKKKEEEAIYQPPQQEATVEKVAEGQWHYDDHTKLFVQIFLKVNQVRDEYVIVWGAGDYKEANLRKEFGGYDIEEAKQKVSYTLSRDIAWVTP